MTHDEWCKAMDVNRERLKEGTTLELLQEAMDLARMAPALGRESNEKLRKAISEIPAPSLTLMPSVEKLLENL